ncbi:hypothetical protein [Lactovum miscens]|uniref:DUF3801 domain-containing protein n=1 Tax=Lactovum miscens TaxID=190387 RepID=A0A841C7M6_9LACT|nr:hypothetical protein [Lactovum miscens]MBB5887592.1 hypothetical protein [Lactovum miscens]
MELDDKAIIDKFFIYGIPKLSQVLYSLSQLSLDKLNPLFDKVSPLKGEVHVFRLLGRHDDVTKTWLNQKVDLGLMKDYLKESGITFSFTKVEGGYNFYYRFNEQKSANEALDKFFINVATNPNQFARRILRKSGKVTFEERLEEAQKMKYKGNLNRQMQTKSKKERA